MAEFASLTAKLNINLTNFTNGMRSASKQASKFASDLSGKINTGVIDPTKKAKFEFKDVGRIVQGILVSKLFYTAFNDIRRATDAVWEFGKSMEYTRITYANLFGDVDLANEFIEVLKDFAAITPFSFEDSEKASKRLLAYGIEAKNVMYIMQGILAASSMQGNAAAIESVSRAIGQISTKGRLMNEEMRQLAEAGIPAYEILIDKLGLTQEQLQNLGRLNIPAHVAINALVDGMTERFGNVVVAASRTITGLMSNIKDNALMVASGIIKPFQDRFRGLLVFIEAAMVRFRNAFELGGMQALFNEIVPEKARAQVLLFIANLLNLATVIKINLKSALELGKYLIVGLVQMFNALSPIITVVLDVLARFTSMIVNNATAMKIFTGILMTATAAWVLFRVQALATLILTKLIGVITAIGQALMFLSAALMANPILTILFLIAAGFVGVTVASSKAGKSVYNYFKALTSFNGVDPDKILLPSQKERANDLEKFNQQLDGTSDNMDKLADSTGKAAKAARGLLAFDEVFNLNDPDETGINGPDLGGWEDIVIGDIDIPEVEVPEIPDFTKFSLDFVDNLIASLKDRLVAVGFGAVIGGILGGLMAGPIGAVLGTLIGGLIGWFWEDLANKIGMSPNEKIGVGIGAGLGAAIGFLIGGPVGGLLGAAVGGLAGWFWALITDGMESNNWEYDKIGIAVGAGFGAAIGFIMGGPAGLVIGGAIGSLVGWIGGLLVEGIEDNNWDRKSISIATGTAVGAGIGLVMAGPPGALIGAALGALVGWVGDKLFGHFKEIKWDKTKITQAITTVIMGAIGLVVGGPLGGILFAMAGPFVGKFIDGMLSGLSEGWKKLKEHVKFIWDWIIEAFYTPEDGESWVQTGANIINGIILGLITGVGLLLDGLWQLVISPIIEGFKKLFGIESPATTMVPVGQYIIAGVRDGIVNGIPNLIAKIGEFPGKVAGAIMSWFTTTGTQMSTWFKEKKEAVGTWASDVQTSVSTFFKDLPGNVKTRLDDTWSNMKTGTGNILSAGKTWISDMWEKVFGKLIDYLQKGINKWKEFWGASGKEAKAGNYTMGVSSPSYTGVSYVGHATGGSFNREHVARFAEGNKMETILPVEDEASMAKVRRAIFGGDPMEMMAGIANNGNNQPSQIMYVGTLIADDASLRALERKMQVIRMNETGRRG